MIAPRPILVTGMPRSGTTWVAHMLAASGRLAYINEPLNPQHPPGGCPGVLNASVDHRFHYICADNEERFLNAYRDLLRLRYHPLAELRRNHRPADVPRQLNQMRTFAVGRVRRRGVLVADPYAVFSIGWFARRLGFRVVVVVRNPAATVSSRKRLGWLYDTDELRGQPLLERDVLDPLGLATATAATTREQQIIDTGALLWTAVYAAVERECDLDPEITVVRHEDLSLDPEGEFGELYQRLGLDFSPKARAAILRATDGGNPTELEASDPHQIRLDSRANLENWRSRLEPAEVERIDALTSPVAARFYPQAAGLAHDDRR